MTPTHKDLILKEWKKVKSSHLDEWEIFGPNNTKLGNIVFWDDYVPYKNQVHISSRFSNKGGMQSVVQAKFPFNYTDYIPEWEKLMDQLLQSIFK